MIVLKTRDKSFVSVIPNPRKYGEGLRPISECKGLQAELARNDSDGYFEHPQVSFDDIEDTAQLYVEGEMVKKDYTWEVMLMPDHVIKRKEIVAVTEKIKVETNPLEAAKLVAELTEVSNHPVEFYKHDVYWAEKALAGLDRAPQDKPVIRAKLQEIINNA